MGQKGKTMVMVKLNRDRSEKKAGAAVASDTTELVATEGTDDSVSKLAVALKQHHEKLRGRLEALHAEESEVQGKLDALERAARELRSDPPAPDNDVRPPYKRRNSSGQHKAIRLNGTPTLAEMVRNVLLNSRGMVLAGIVDSIKAKHPEVNAMSLGTTIYKLASDGTLKAFEDERGHKLFALTKAG